MFNSAGGYNSDNFNGSGFAVQPVDVFSPDQPFIMQVRSNTDVFLRKVEGWYNGSWTDKINDPGSLKFTVPLNGVLAQTGDLVYPNRIWLYDGRLVPLRQFVILKVKSNANKGTMDIECVGLSYLLKQEFVIGTTVTGTAINMRTQVKAILSAQGNANPITLGHMANKYALADITIGAHSDKSIWGALMNLWKQHGGVIGIDYQGRLFWIDDAFGNPPFAMTLYEDIETYEEITNADSVINRVYAKGIVHFDGSTHDRQALPTVGYVEDTTSQGLYGIREKRINLNLEDQTELTLAAQRILSRFKNPQITRNISAIDLARVQLDPDNPIVPHIEYIWAGGKIKVNPPPNVPNATTFSTMILSVTRSLDNFLSVKISVGEGAQPDKNGRRILDSNSDTEFFEILAEEFEDFSEFEETLYQEDDYIWDFLDDLSDRFGTIETPETDVNQIQSVKTSASLGSNVKFAPSDHSHEGIPPLVHNVSWTLVSQLGNPQEESFGYLGSAAAASLRGRYWYPPDGTTNADWIADPAYA